MRQLIENLDKMETGVLRSIYTGLPINVNESQWAVSYIWPKSMGVGYETFTCSGHCPSANALNDLHHRFASEAAVENARIYPLNFVDLLSGARILICWSQLKRCVVTLQGQRYTWPYVMTEIIMMASLIWN